MAHGLKQRRRGRVRTGIVAAALLLALLPLGFLQTSHASGVVLKVGYSGQGSVQANEDGSYSGYLVDYLEEIAKYTGWEYEYIYASWEENVEKLKKGELDLLGMVRHTEEREGYFLFSSLSMAHDYTALCAAGDSDIYYQDYEAFDGCRVGVISEMIYEDTFAGYAQSLGLDYELVHFTTDEEAKRALLAGEIDLYTTSGYSSHSGLKVVDRFQLERAYLVTGLENQALMEELDKAVQQARIMNPGLESDLAEKYYSFGASLYLTREEKEYLDSVGPIVVKGFEGRMPLGYTTKDGEFVGVLADYLDMLGAVSGLEFVHEASEVISLEGNVPVMEEEGCALLFIDQPLEELGLCKTEALFETGLAYIKRQEDAEAVGDGSVFAVNREMGYVGDMLLAANENFTVRYYDTSLACMEAVANGEADMTIQDEHVAAYLLQKPKFEEELAQAAGEAYVDSMCLYAPQEHQYLISILNKTLECLSKEQRLNAVSNAMISHSYKYQLEDLLYEYGTLIRVSLGSLVVIIALCAMLYVRIVRLRLQKKENEELQEQIQLDELTGVYNRAGFFNRAGDMIRRGGDDLCVIRLNISHFKLINELHGTEKGDRLLQEVGRGLMELSRRKGFVAGRFTADHFYLCIRREDFESIGFARRAPAPWLGIDISMTYGVYPVETQKDIPVSAMCDRADMSIKSHKQSAPEYIHYYSDETRQRLLREQEIENEMEQALEQRQFCIYIQPKYDVETGSIVGGEALVRWNHPRKGMIPPGDFIELFEKNGFIMRLDYYVWEECCRFLADAKEKGLPPYPLSINVSRIHFFGTALRDKLLELIARYGLDAGELELEITESMCAEDPEVIFSKCEELRRLGFRVAMDDFGSGYSSLNMLKDMPLDIIKMDLKFLSGETDAAQAEKGRDILRALIIMAHTLGLKVVVEGLETEDQKNFIRSVGKCSAQGYYYSKPVDCRSYEAMIG